ncbi:CsbD family protein [Sphingomonas sp. TZW2008]|uniref:CsbD family protein n=1 Tax=Sphingomonas sp. TZW2008 TaxID=1917973 RepID=UPI000A26B23B|nr:CsbD family protein [Sphingomonas sp. TZW2008]
MNKDEVHGGVRYVGGKAEKFVGDVIDDRGWQVDGVVDQVAGAVQHSYGRAVSVAEDAIETAPGALRDAIDDVQERAAPAMAAAKQGARSLADEIRDNPGLWAAGAALGGYALGWLIHRPRD